MKYDNDEYIINYNNKGTNSTFRYNCIKSKNLNLYRCWIDTGWSKGVPMYHAVLMHIVVECIK